MLPLNSIRRIGCDNSAYNVFLVILTVPRTKIFFLVYVENDKKLFTQDLDGNVRDFLDGHAEKDDEIKNDKEFVPSTTINNVCKVYGKLQDPQSFIKQSVCFVMFGLKLKKKFLYYSNL